MPCGFRILEHPSDLGIEAWGPTVRDAFGEAARGLMSVLLEQGRARNRGTKTLDIAGSDIENLLVKFLSEVLYVFDAGHFVTTEVEISEMTVTRLRGVLKGEPFDPSRHVPKTDVKAVTYHQLRVQQEPNDVSLTVYVDI